MDDRLEKLTALQNLQNAQVLENRVKELEQAQDSLQTDFEELKKTLSTLHMDFHRLYSKEQTK